MLLEGVDVDLCVPGVKHFQFSEFSHPLAIRRRRCSHRIVSDSFGKATVSRGQYETCAQALYVPFPWTRERLVEVVDVENQDPFGRSKAAKVRQVAIAARLYVDPRYSGSRQVSRLNDRCTTIERERRYGHPLILNGNQTRNPISVRFLEPFNDVHRLGPGLPFRLRSTRAFIPKRFPLLASFSLGWSDSRVDHDIPPWEATCDTELSASASAFVTISPLPTTPSTPLQKEPQPELRAAAGSRRPK